MLTSAPLLRASSISLVQVEPLLGAGAVPQSSPVSFPLDSFDADSNEVGADAPEVIGSRVTNVDVIAPAAALGGEDGDADATRDGYVVLGSAMVAGAVMADSAVPPQVWVIWGRCCDSRTSRKPSIAAWHVLLS